MTKKPCNDHFNPAPGTPKRLLAHDARLTELARATGARRHGEVAPESGPELPLPDAALVVGLALQSVRLNGRVPMPVSHALERLAASGEPTARTVLAWLGQRKRLLSVRGRTMR